VHPSSHPRSTRSFGQWRYRRSCALDRLSPAHQPRQESDYEDDETAVPGNGVNAATQVGTVESDDLALDLREAEVLSSVEVLSAFTSAKSGLVNQPHSSVLAQERGFCFF
jgi:hypothetical protein